MHRIMAYGDEICILLVYSNVTSRSCHTQPSINRNRGGWSHFSFANKSYNIDSVHAMAILEGVLDAYVCLTFRVTHDLSTLDYVGR
jgi:hypothetical protein